MIRAGFLRAPSGVAGRRIDAYQEGSATYSSSYDSTVSTLKLKYCYNAGFTRVIPLLMLHGFAETSLAFTNYDWRPLADAGCLVVMPDMRGRNGCSGSQDASGREILDILDALAWARTDAVGVTADTKRAIMCGFSGGGGNTHATALKCPDLFSFRAPYCGIADYGEDGSTSWYIQVGGIDATLDSWVGSPRATVIEYYKTRNPVTRAPGWLALDGSGVNRYRIYHDHDDATVNRSHAESMAAALAAANVPHTLNESVSTDSRRYLHGYPHDTVPAIVDSFGDWLTDAVNAPHWTIPATGGPLVVGGFVITRRFEIWTGPTSSPTPRADTSHGGREVVLELLAYDVGAGTYQVRPHTTCYVQVLQGTKSAIQQVTANTIATLTVS